MDGRRVLEWGGWYGSRLLGFNHPALRTPAAQAALLRAALHKVPNPDFLTPECLAYYRLLHRLAPRCMRGDGLEVYAVNSGAEAVENMMKYLLNLHDAGREAAGRAPGPRRFMHFDQSFHGRTVFALQITRLAQDPLLRRNFEGVGPGNIEVPFPHLDHTRPEAANRAEMEAALACIGQRLQAHAGEVVAIVAEPIQGAGGHRLAHPEFFPRLSELAHRHGVPLAFDEVQTAGGQTGDVFMVDQLGLPHPPQAVAVAKKFGNGAVFMREPMRDVGVLDSTWGGALTDMVRFCLEWAVVEDEGLLASVPARARRLEEGLRRLEGRFPHLLFNVRGLGLYQGFSLRRPEDKGRLVDLAMQTEDLMLLGAGRRSVRFRPPLDLADADTDEMLRRLERCLARL